MSCSLNLYAVYDNQFKFFSDPFLSADDSAAERLMVQTSLLSEGFRSRLVFTSVFCLGSYDAMSKCPIKPLKRPRFAVGSKRLMDLVDATERAQNDHLASDSVSDSDVQEVSEIE